MEVPKRVLVIRIGRLGDTLLATPIIQALQQFCGSEVVIDFAVSPGSSALILGMDRRVNRVFPIKHRKLPWLLESGKRQLAAHSKKRSYDLVFNLECGNQCDDFINFVHTREFFGRPLIAPHHQPGRHCVDTEKTIYADVLGTEATKLAVPALSLVPGEADRPPGIEDDYVIINPGFSAVLKRGYRSHRRWPDSHWLTLMDLMVQSGYTIAINGTAEEEKCFETLLAKQGTHSLFGSALSQLVETIAGARCMISVDTASMHLANALGRPVIALFGPTQPDLTGPYPGKVPSRVLTSGIDCQPCFQTALQKQCSFNRCMQELSPELVFDTFESMMRQIPLATLH